jgi:hypothetical protein
MVLILRLGRFLPRALLGMFVLGQFVFLFGINTCEVVRHYLDTVPGLAETYPQLPGKGAPSRRYLDGFEQVGDRWAELTGQMQKWSLFAPGVSADIPFLAVELRWDEEPDGARSAVAWVGAAATGQFLPAALCWAAMAPPPPVYLLSDNEPRDIHRYLRWGKFRLRRYESALDVSLHVFPDKEPEEMELKWRQQIFDRVADEATAMRAYLEYRWQTYQESHPNVPLPRQVILHVRVYRVPAPPGPEPWTWTGPVTRPMARWRPHVHDLAGAPPVERYDLIAERFDPLP